MPHFRVKSGEVVFKIAKHGDIFFSDSDGTALIGLEATGHAFTHYMSRRYRLQSVGRGSWWRGLEQTLVNYWDGEEEGFGMHMMLVYSCFWRLRKALAAASERAARQSWCLV